MTWLEGDYPGCTLADIIMHFFIYENLFARLLFKDVDLNRF